MTSPVTCQSDEAAAAVDGSPRTKLVLTSDDLQVIILLFIITCTATGGAGWGAGRGSGVGDVPADRHLFHIM